MIPNRALIPLLVLSLAACGGKGDEAPADTSDTQDTQSGDDDDAPGDDDDAPGDDDDGPTTDVVSVEVSAATGGEVVIGSATLSIPAGALAADTTITVEAITPDGSVPDSATVTGEIYDFGPDGLTFLTPATLELPATTAPGTGQALVISWLDGDTWVDLPTTDNGGTVSAEIEHFTWFSVRVVDASGQVVECAPFAACGGDPVGSWDFDAVCLDFSMPNPYCPSGTFTINIILNEGWIDIDTGGTWYQYADVASEIVTTMPAACLPPGVASCSEFDDPYENVVCSGDPALECTCVQAEANVSSSNGQWTTNGNLIRLTEQGGYPEDMEYCVNGNVMQLWDTDDMVQYDLSK